jgi:hypothetical protein
MALSNTSRLTGGEVLETKHSAFGISSPKAEIERLCPECGAAMVEFDRLAEDAAVFIWYACSQEGCTGQWLTKRAVRMCGA